IQFQDRRLDISGIRRDQCFTQGWQRRGFFLSMQSLKFGIPQRSVLTLVDYFALRRLSGSLLGVVLSRHVAADFHDFVSDRFCNDISAFHWELARSPSILRLLNAGNEP